MSAKYCPFLLCCFCLLSFVKADAQFVSPVKLRESSDSLNSAQQRLKQPAALKYNYYRELGAACKVEWKLERATKVPLRLRLGSLQQTDYLERKPNAQPPQ